MTLIENILKSVGCYGINQRKNRESPVNKSKWKNSGYVAELCVNMLSTEKFKSVSTLFSQQKSMTKQCIMQMYKNGIPQLKTVKSQWIQHYQSMKKFANSPQQLSQQKSTTKQFLICRLLKPRQWVAMATHSIELKFRWKLAFQDVKESTS